MGNLWWVTQSESTTLNGSWPSPTCSPVNPVDHFRWKELFTRFAFVDSTALINLGDPCKRAFTFHYPRLNPPTSFFPFISFFLKCVQILLLNIHILQQHLPAQVHLPPFWNRLPRSLLWNRENSIVQPLNSISLIQPCWSTCGTRVNAP